MVWTMRRRPATNDSEIVISKRKVVEVDTKYSFDQEDFEFHGGPVHSDGILHNLDSFRNDDLFTDVVIKAGGKEFRCHRAVLAACSPYFKAMFTNNYRERNSLTIEISGIDRKMMEILLSFIYTGHATIEPENVPPLYEASNLFQIKQLGDACVQFIAEQQDPCNCLGFLRFAEIYSLDNLVSACLRYARENFTEVLQHEEFLDLKPKELKRVIDSDELCVCKEEYVFEAVMRWVNHNVDKRMSSLRELLGLVRLPLLHPTYFVQVVEGDPLIQKFSDVYDLIYEARCYHVLGMEITSPRTRPRRSTGVAEVIVVVGGCERTGGFNVPYTESFDPEDGVWRPLKKLPEFTKSEYAVCALRNDILVSGGRINSRDVWMYNSQLNIWIKVAPLSKGRWRHKMGVLLGKAYAVGGYDGHRRLNHVEFYDSHCNRWKEVAPMIEAVSSPAVAGCAKKLFVIGGGIEDDVCTNVVQCFDPETDSWNLRANLPIAKNCISAASLNQMIYVCGGLTPNIFCYDPNTDVWMNVAQMDYKVENCGMSVCNSKVFILGGRGTQGDALDTICCFDPEKGICQSPEKMSRPISHHGCVTIHCHNKARSGVLSSGTT
uniref:Kelch-like 24 n=1 Tax=Nothobranchius rachovii TaxID=451742 RepID=A0A1A8PHY7_9TELE